MAVKSGTTLVEGRQAARQAGNPGQVEAGRDDSGRKAPPKDCHEELAPGR
jgi:hypothetical protein